MTAQLDPKRFEDAAGASLQFTEIAERFWTMYESEAARCDKAFVERHDKRFNFVFVVALVYSFIGLGFARLQFKFKPNPDGRTESLLQAILLTLNPGEVPIVSPVQEAPNEFDTVLSLFYNSSVLCFLAAVFALWAK